MKGPRAQRVQIVLVAALAIFMGGSFPAGFEPGQQVTRTFASTLWAMLKLLPCAFVLIALFDVWVRRETVERRLGKGSGPVSYLWAILLAGMTVGGMYVGFPVAYTLFRKGAKLSVVFAYVGFTGVCRIPMTMFEASFMGAPFTALRLGVSVPLVLVSSLILGRLLERRGYQVTE